MENRQVAKYFLMIDSIGIQNLIDKLLKGIKQFNNGAVKHVIVAIFVDACWKRGQSASEHVTKFVVAALQGKRFEFLREQIISRLPVMFLVSNFS